MHAQWDWIMLLDRVEFKIDYLFLGLIFKIMFQNTVNLPGSHEFQD
jgi:hypothetical protein